MHGFILIREIRLLFDDDFRMFLEEVFVIKDNAPDDTQTICDNAEFIGITKVAVDIKLSDGTLWEVLTAL